MLSPYLNFFFFFLNSDTVNIIIIYIDASDSGPAKNYLGCFRREKWVKGFLSFFLSGSHATYRNNPAIVKGFYHATFFTTILGQMSSFKRVEKKNRQFFWVKVLPWTSNLTIVNCFFKEKNNPTHNLHMPWPPVIPLGDPIYQSHPIHLMMMMER